MTLYLKKSRNSGTYTYQYLKEVYHCELLCFRIENEYIAVPIEELDKNYEIVITSTKDEPLWKQAMKIQRGQIPRPREERRVYHIRPLSEDYCKRLRFYLYEKER